MRQGTARPRTRPHAAEATRREDPLATTDHLIDAVAVGIERRGVHVDLMTFRIDELEAVRQPASGLNVPACAERLLDLRGVLEPRDEVEVVVRPRLLAEERVDRPAAVQPELDPRSFEVGEKIQDAAPRPSRPEVPSRGLLEPSAREAREGEEVREPRQREPLAVARGKLVDGRRSDSSRSSGSAMRNALAVER